MDASFREHAAGVLWAVLAAMAGLAWLWSGEDE